jgi:hypothetical protein
MWRVVSGWKHERVTYSKPTRTQILVWQSFSWAVLLWQLTISVPSTNQPMTASVNNLYCQIHLRNNYVWVIFFSMTLQPNLGLCRLVLMFLDLTHTHIHPVALLCTSDQPVANAAIYTTRNKRKITNIHALNTIRTRGPNNQHCSPTHSSAWPPAMASEVINPTETHCCLAICQLLLEPGKTIQAMSH